MIRAYPINKKSPRVSSPLPLIRFFTKGYLFLILLLPVAVIDSTSIYVVSSPDYINYKYLSYSFSALAIPGIVAAFFLFRRVRVLPVLRLIVLIALWNVAHALFIGNEVFASFHFQMFLVMLQAWSLLVLVFFFYPNGLASKFIDLYVVLCFASQILRAILGLSTDGRFGAIGLSVGGSGFLYATYLVYLVFSRELSPRSIFLMVLAFFGLMLTGQRTNMVFLGLFLVAGTLIVVGNFLLRRGRSVQKNRIMFLAGLQAATILLLGTIFYIYLLGFDLNNMSFIARAIAAVSEAFNGNIEKVSSVSGRVLSIVAGLQVITDQPLGLSNDFYDLQRNIQEKGYPTFPHSTLLSVILLWSSPIAFLVVLYIMNLLRRLSRNRSALIAPVLFVVVINVFWGGPFLDYPILFIVIFFLSLALGNSVNLSPRFQSGGVSVDSGRSGAVSQEKFSR